jgi:hypothetical protein
MIEKEFEAFGIQQPIKTQEFVIVMSIVVPLLTTAKTVT